MTLQRIDHIGVVVNDLPAAKAFFIALGFEVEGEAELAGELPDRITGLDGVRTSVVFLRVPGGHDGIELIKFHTPTDESGIQPVSANTLGIRHITFAVEDIGAVVDTLKAQGGEPFSKIQQYENEYKLCYIRGPEGIILELAERITK